MTIGIGITPRSRAGLQLSIFSVFSNLVAEGIERKFKGKTTNEDAALDSILEDYMASHIKQVNFGLYMRPDSLQYDPKDKHLFSNGKLFETNSEFPPDSELLEQLAEHILVGLSDIQEQQKNDAPVFGPQKTKTADGKLGNLLSWVIGSMYFPLISIRLMAVCYQLMMFKKVHAMLPLIFGKKAKRALAFIDQRLIDPVDFHAHIRKRCREMWDDTTGKPDDGDPQ